MNEYDITAAFKAIENELIASMIRNMDRHRAEETKEGIQWSMWQAEQLKALEKYKRENQKRYNKQFAGMNGQIAALIQQARADGNMKQEIQILKAIQRGYRFPNMPKKLFDLLEEMDGKTFREKASILLKRFKGKEAAKGTAEFFRLNDRKLAALIKATTDDMNKAETAVLRMANDQYRKAIFNAQVYANTGAGTYEKAVDMATRNMLSTGLNCVQYANGARHTLSDYADMAIRTASKRAYLQGEGEKRQEWGISTVIINKRGNPCPKCLPFVGKVLIDDVWSRGKQSDGPYPLMSTAIAAGLYHPRCKDGHTTYFQGISTADDTWTAEELEAIGQKNKEDAQQQYASRQAEKFGRLAGHSLDKENQRIYKERELSWKEQSTKGRIPETVLNRNEVESSGYKRRIDALSESEEVRKVIWQEMKEAIKHRSGTDFEDLIFIDSVTGKMKRSVDFEKARTAKPTKAMRRMLKDRTDHTIIAIHNHPGSSVPSWDDIIVAADRKYKCGLIACHDGNIIKYEIERQPIELFYRSAVAKLDKTGYTKESLKEFCEAMKDAGVKMEVL